MSSIQAAATKSAHHQPEPDLFTPYRLGDLDLKSRIAMAPMTRSRARSAAMSRTRSPPPIMRSAPRLG